MGFILWLDSGLLRYKLIKKVLNLDLLLEEITQKKDEIVEILKVNDCHTEESFLNKIILKNRNIEVPLSFSQERLLFIDKFEGGTSAYNISEFYRIKYSSQIFEKPTK